MSTNDFLYLLLICGVIIALIVDYFRLRVNKKSFIEDIKERFSFSDTPANSKIIFKYTKKWADEQIFFLNSRIGIYRPEAGLKFFFEPTPGFYGFIAQGNIESLNQAINMLSDHIQSPSAPIIEKWEGPLNPVVTEYHDFSSDSAPPGLIRYDGPYRSRIQVAITNKHSPIILGAILAHELTHHYLMNKGIHYSDINENECLVDLATVFLGLGKLTLNGYIPISWEIKRKDGPRKFTYQVGYLSAKELGYIFNKISTFRGIPLNIAQTNLFPEANKLFMESC